MYIRADQVRPNAEPTRAPWPPTARRPALGGPAPAPTRRWNCVHRRRSGWIPLEDPKANTPDIVPGTTRVKDSAFRPPSAAEVNVGVVGRDDRRPWTNTLDRPYRWVCKLQVSFKARGRSTITTAEGTGVVIGDRHVLTTAHNLLDRDTPSGTIEEAHTVVVIPGLNGVHASAKRAMPFGWTWGEAYRTTRAFRSLRCRHGFKSHGEDFAVIRLAEDLGSRAFPTVSVTRFGHWGDPTWGAHTLLSYKTAASLRGVPVNVLGYPGDKCADRPVGRAITEKELRACSASRWASVPWHAYGRILSVEPEGVKFGEMTLEHDFAPGMSGSPVWLRWKGFRNMIGLASDAQTDPGRKSNLAVRFTRDALAEILGWIG